MCVLYVCLLYILTSGYFYQSLLNLCAPVCRSGRMALVGGRVTFVLTAYIKACVTRTIDHNDAMDI